MTTSSAKVVLAIGAHPDDVEFGCGATMAKLASEGHILYFVIATQGNRGSRARTFAPQELIDSRKKEQLQAAKILGAKEVLFLDHEDGNLSADIDLKEEIVRLIRKLRPEIVFTHDPAWFYRFDEGFSSVNHNDHRETGKAVSDAVYPLSRDLLSFPHHVDEGLTPHTVREVYLYGPDKPNHFEDVTEFVDLKLQSIFAHKSQIDKPDEVGKRVQDRLEKFGRQSKTKYAEAFVKLTLR